MVFGLITSGRYDTEVINSARIFSHSRQQDNGNAGSGNTIHLKHLEEASLRHSVYQNKVNLLESKYILLVYQCILPHKVCKSNFMYYISFLYYVITLLRVNNVHVLHTLYTLYTSFKQITFAVSHIYSIHDLFYDIFMERFIKRS